eukprot:TRINITY_DN7902_c0_g1_i1.p2 TRINITY_DN7902_c0_g1~~TRINITY_DN7902_c0_g1_i1.p2  ORF type:complete len:202 (+),score=37.85 TRINITY_DN7902_c0_g1_i1:740-1345(+)
MASPKLPQLASPGPSPSASSPEAVSLALLEQLEGEMQRQTRALRSEARELRAATKNERLRRCTSAPPTKRKTNTRLPAQRSLRTIDVKAEPEKKEAEFKAAAGLAMFAGNYNPKYLATPEPVGLTALRQPHTAGSLPLMQEERRYREEFAHFNRPANPLVQFLSESAHYRKCDFTAFKRVNYFRFTSKSPPPAMTFLNSSA